LLHAQQSDFQGATKNFESAHQRDEAQPEVAYNLGLAQFKTGNFASAAEPLRKAETLSAASAVESRRFRCPAQTLSNARDERSVAAAAMGVVGGVASRAMIGLLKIAIATPTSRPKFVGRPKLFLQRIVPAETAGGPVTSNALMA